VTWLGGTLLTVLVAGFALFVLGEVAPGWGDFWRFAAAMGAAAIALRLAGSAVERLVQRG
jgi:hypothetical protein